MSADWVGREIGDYLVLERIGIGSMAEVYKALQPSMERMVGVKIVSPALSHDPQFVARFRREVQIAALLEHPHILPVIDFGDCEGTLYLVMRYINGGTLHELIDCGPLPPQHALRYLTEIGEALDYAHGRRVVHRDIKPKNVLLDEQGNPFIGDFGLAKLMESGGLTSSGLEMIGTPHYMSPEQARGQTVDGRSDLYSLGVVLFQMLTGKVPFEADSTVGIIMKHIGAPVPDITEHAPNLPEDLNLVVAKAMAKDPADRFQSAREMTAAVAQALGTSVLAGPIVARAIDPPRVRGLAGWWRARSRRGLTVERKLAILIQWIRHWLGHRPAGGETFTGLVRRLFPTRGQQSALLAGSLMLFTLVVFSGFVLLKGLSAAAAPVPPTFVPTLVRQPTPFGGNLQPSYAATAAFTPNPTGTRQAPTQASAGTADQTLGTGEPTSQAIVTDHDHVLEQRDLMTLVYVPAGTFLLGASDSDPYARDNEKPQLDVYLDAFWIDRTEVTVAQFQEFVSATHYETDAEQGCCEGQYTEPGGMVYSPDEQYVVNATWRLPLGGGGQPASPRHPVVQVSWRDAVAYCTWAGRRLPTEAEWEKAARGTTGLIYPWGNIFDGRRANACDKNCGTSWHSADDDGFPRTGTVGMFVAGASPYDVLDMAGNVWEWVHDFYDFRGYFRVPTANPPGLEAGLTHSLRGGSWLDSADRLRTTARDSNLPDARNNVTGFRCASTSLP